ncbi:MAG: mechanosensitive ion channel family protein [Phascolarctobacterium sp.]|nr:mechanosensitive ion channel family protein [Phascolarctobacterium sp.]
MEEFLTLLKPWQSSILALLGFTIVRYLYKKVILNILRKATELSPFSYDEDILDAFEHPINVMLFIGGIYSAINLAPISTDYWAAFLDRVLRSAIVLCFFWGCYNMSDTTHGVLLKVLERAGIRSEEAVSNIFSTILRLLIVILCFVTVAKEWNYDISGFVASLGIGSLAVAFAAKDALANVFGSLVIILDKPFQVGEWVLANGYEGIVEKVTFRSTCLRTFPHELVYIPNSLLSNTPIINYSRREKRRIDFLLGLTYGTTHDQMLEVIQKIQAYLEAQEDLHTDDVRVHFFQYGASSLDIRVTCHAKTGESLRYLDIVQRINLDLMKIMEQVGVSCAFPSTSIYFETPLKNELINTKDLFTPEQKV